MKSLKYCCKRISYLPASVGFFFSLLVIMIISSPVFAEEVDCLMCHEQLSKEKVVHPAIKMGCPICHTAINAADIPHKKTNKIAKGLSAEQPELCYGCHDKAKFNRKTIHAAVGMGCTGCHNPHSSKNSKLLISGLPDLCFNCHDKSLFAGKKNIHPPVMRGMCIKCHNPHSTDIPKLLLSESPDLCYNCHDKLKFTGKFIHAPVGIGMCPSCHAPHQAENEKLLLSLSPDLCYNCHDKAEFNKKNIHAPVASGACLTCHKPHTSEDIALLKKDPNKLCFDCHAGVRKIPHAVAGFSFAGHPLGMVKKGKKAIDDPARPGKKFYCGSCHNPHSSDSMLLYRYETSSTIGLCMYCHKM